MKRDAVFNAIPRRKGEFYQRQIDANLEAGATMLYVAMFDEVDEATAIFKAGQAAPVGRPFVTHEGLPADHYLKLTGQAAARLRQSTGRN
jgi:2-keto-3-deoxy-L-rhamnonate aldolase RhmA